MRALPTLLKVLHWVILSLTKNKYKYKGNYQAAKDFTATVDPKHLQAFCSYFGYKNPVPLPYFYILAQRAHLGLMVEKAFPVPVVGLVHLENTLTQLSPIDITKPFEIKATVLGMPAKGSIPFQFRVLFFQDGIQVIECVSLYLSKRKSNQPKKAKEEVAMPALDFAVPFTIAANKGLSYAKLSGDYNPIHTSSILAKLFGFKKKIIHGWYTVCHSMAEIENKYSIQAKEVYVSFNTPIFLPGKAVLHHTAEITSFKPINGFSHINFAVSDTNNSLLYVEGGIQY